MINFNFFNKPQESALNRQERSKDVSRRQQLAEQQGLAMQQEQNVAEAMRQFKQIVDNPHNILILGSDESSEQKATILRQLVEIKEELVDSNSDEAQEAKRTIESMILTYDNKATRESVGGVSDERLTDFYINQGLSLDSDNQDN